jgi:hypothetical protein
VSWSYHFRGDADAEVFDAAKPAAGQLMAALRGLWAAERELPGLRHLGIEWFTGPARCDGYYVDARPDRIGIRSGISPAETERVARHEAAHAYFYQAERWVGPEDLCDSYAAGTPGAIRRLRHVAYGNETIRIVA